MKTELKNVCHLYTNGCEYVFIGEDRPFIKKGDTKKLMSFHLGLIKDSNNFKLLLRPLTSLTLEEDQIIFPKNNRGHKIDMHWYPEGFLWLLQNSFDLFGLIESGQAIDKTKL